MPTFEYKALDSEGVVSLGLIEAKTRSEAYQKLTDSKLRPIQIAQRGEASPVRKSGGGGESGLRRPMRLSSSRLLQFTEELADLLEAGLQLEPALHAMESREEDSPVKLVAGFLRQQLREGKSLSGALQMCGGIFSELYINMVAAGEATGALDSILRRQAQYTGVIIDLQKRVMMALIYPAIVFAAGVVLLTIFMVFLLPQLTSLLTKTGRQLPVVTQMLIATSEFMTHYWWALFSVAGILFFLQKLWIRSASGRKTWDRLVLRLPLIGLVLKQKFLAQFLQTLATLVSNGVVLLNALILMRNATANTHIRSIVDNLAVQMGEGASLSRCMKKSGFFPPVSVDIVAVGEQTGKIGLALQRGAARYDKEFNAQIQRLTILIQPLTIFIVAIFVGVIAYSMITGILTTVSGLKMR